MCAAHRAATGATRHTPRVPRLVYLAARLVTALCLLALGVAAVFDARAERFTAGRVPSQFAQRLDPSLGGDYDDVIGVAHNAGDDLGSAKEAVAYGADAIEIDVRSAGGDLFASHDAPVPGLAELIFRGPRFQDAWDVAALRDTVLLHVKERSPRSLRQVMGFLAARPMRRVIVQTKHPQVLRTLREKMPAVQRLLLVLDDRDVQDLQRDPVLLEVLDGVSVRESLLTAPRQAWFEQRGLRTFAWTVNDERRMNELVSQGIDGLITERLDMMRLLGKGPERAL